MRKNLLALACLLAFALPSWAALSGNYTINALAPASATNYQSITSAIGDLNLGFRLDGGPVNGPGVSGPVVLRIAAGTGPYNEQITFPVITGASATNTIRLTGGPTRETVTFPATTTADRQVIKLNGSRHVILDSLTLINTGTLYGYGVHITLSADSNVVRNCIVHVDSTSTSANFAGITISSTTVTTNGFDNGDDNLIENNVVNGGYYSLSARGTSTTVFNLRNRFINNTCRSYYYYGTSMAYQKDGEIRGNRLTARSTGSTLGYGIYMLNCDQMNVLRNNVLRFGTYGIYASVLQGTGTRSKIVNNMVGGLNLSTTTPYGIFITGTTSSNTDVWHNTVHLANTSTGGRGYHQAASTGTGYDVRNNNFSVINSTSGYALYVTTSGLASNVINYNNYYAPGSINFVFIGVAYTPGTFIGGGGYNANSVTGDPGLVSTTNLHVGTGVQLWDVGTNVGITTDYDGETRPLAPTALYDIGADEHTPPLNDAGITALNSPTPPFAAGTLPVTVTLKNFGLATLTSAWIGWKVNGVSQTPYGWTGSLAPAGSASGINIGSYNFVAGNTYLFKIWSYSPNASADANNTNDTLTISVCTGLSGTYTIGGGGDFATVNAAIDALECGGVAGPVTLRINPGAGPFNEQVLINPIPGASATNTIRLTGGPTRDTIQTTTTTLSDRYVIKLNGADHFILDSLVIINTNFTYAFTVQLINDADSNVISNCILVVDSASTSSNISNLSFSGDAPGTLNSSGDGNLILNNDILGGYYGINVRGLNTTTFESDNKFVNNRVRGIYYYGMYIQYQNGTLVSRNDIKIRSTGSTAAYGIFLSYVDLFTIDRNYIREFGSYGIYGTSANYQGGIGTTRAKITNNMIGGVNRGTTAYGLYFTTNSSYIDHFHNTVSLTGNGRCIYLLSGTNNAIRNNIFSLQGASTGYAAYVTSTAYISSMDYNNYYIPSSTNFIYVGLAYTPATFIGGGGYNLNSKNGDPEFVDPSFDLHTFSVLTNDVGDNTAGVTVDIDGDTRPIGASTIVDMGADEYTPLQYNAEPMELVNPGSGDCPDSLVPVYVSVRNMGLAPMTGIIVTVDITGAAPAVLSDTLTDPLPTGAMDTLLVGYWNSYPGGINNFNIYTDHPLEEYRKNDTIDAVVSVGIEPPAPTAVGATGCSPSDLTLYTNPDGFVHRWYDAPSAGTLLLQGDTLTTGPISTTTTYYVEALGYNSGNLTTTFAAGNGCMGNMFDATPTTSLRIDSLDLHIGATGSETVTVYYRVGGFAGFETSPGAWIPVDTVVVTGAGAGLPTRVVLGTPLNLPAGVTYGIYVTLTTTNIDYTNGTTTYSNPDITLALGTGLCSAFGGLNASRIWNGTLYYTTEGCPSPRVPVEATIIPTPVVDLGPDTTTCGTPVVLDAANPGADYNWSTAQITQTISVFTSGTYDVTVNYLGCVSSDTVVVTINSIPAAGLGPDTTICDGEIVTLGPAFSPTASYLWSTTDTTPTIDVGTAGTYYVDVVDTISGCTNTDTVAVNVLFAPSGAFSVDTTFCPVVSFSSTVTGDGPFTYAWDFGDGNTSTLDNPTNDYTVAGNGLYNVVLVVTNSCGSDTITFSVDIDCIAANEGSLSQGISLWPNPSNGVFHLTSSIGTDVNYEVMSLHGQVILTGTVPAMSTADLSLLDASKGVYTVLLRNGDQIETIKLVVQ